MTKELKTHKVSSIYKFIIPSFIVYVVAIILPLFLCLGISLTNWRGGKKMDFIGLQNYILLLKDRTFWLAFLHNLEFILILMVTQIGFAFILSLLYQNKRIIGREFHRKAIFFPAILAPMVVGMLWQLVYRNDIGLIASLFKLFGKDGNIPWLSSKSLVIPSICITLTWQYIGQFMIIIMAGMQNIDESILEAAEIDGATSFNRARYIVFPLLKSTLAVCMIICISGCMKMFDIIFIMSGGGPGRASMVTALYSYDLAFKAQKISYASTTAIGMTVLSLALIIISRKVLGGKKNEND